MLAVAAAQGVMAQDVTAQDVTAQDVTALSRLPNPTPRDNVLGDDS